MLKNIKPETKATIIKAAKYTTYAVVGFAVGFVGKRLVLSMSPRQAAAVAEVAAEAVVEALR